MIMATSQNGYSAECLVVCQAKITGIKINPVTANMTVGQKITLTATTSPEIVTEKVTWKSRNEDVAKVDNNGNVTGIGKRSSRDNSTKSRRNNTSSMYSNSKNKSNRNKIKLL